jgi:hypothetical protein
MSNVLSLSPATRALTGSLKSLIADAALALEGDTITIALRSNGPKIDGTLVMIDGAPAGDQFGDSFNARNGQNQRPYGEHTVLGTVSYKVADGKVEFTRVNAMIDVDLATFKAPVFMVA